MASPRRLRLARRAAPLLIGAALLLALPAQSGAVGFGTNLNRAPDNTTATCGNFQLPFYTFPSCSFTSVNLNTGESGLPPVGRGIVTQARVRVGPVTGPMQIVVEQALRQDNPGDPGHPIYACCQAINAGPVFTPRPNAITAVRLNLPVRQDIAPDPRSGYYVDQHLALSVLAPDVPIPAATDPGAFYSGWFPAWKVGDERAGPYGGSGAAITFDAQWRSCGKARGASAQSAAKKRKKKSPCGKKKKKKKGKKGKR
jgi:hypothetical protein